MSMRMTSGPSFTLDRPEFFFRWLAQAGPQVDFSTISVAEMWSLVAAAALARRERPHRLVVTGSEETSSRRFAHAVGFDDAIDNHAGPISGEAGRTVRMVRVTDEERIHPVANEISELLVPEAAHDTARTTLGYVMVELLRNVLQHSQDELGAIVGAQRNFGGRNTSQPFIQVAVADSGVGILTALSRQHPELRDAREALDKALWPHFSGTFPEGKTGNQENAGLGLFVISEMAKAVGGRLVVASRGATLVLEPGPSPDIHRQRYLDAGVGFDGTLVAFEIPEQLSEDFETLFQRILDRARERTPSRNANEVLNFTSAPVNVAHVFIQPLSENVTRAKQLAQSKLIPSIVSKTPVCLDFVNVGAITQSFAHALLFEAMRVAWALHTPIYVVNAKPAVRSALELVQSYAMGG